MLFSELPILVNIINLFNYSKLIKQCDIDELELTIADLIDHFIETQPLSVSNYNFHTNINDYLYNIIHIQLVICTMIIKKNHCTKN